MAKKNALGRGLGALIEDASPERAPNSDSLINEISINTIVANPWQPRTIFDEEALDELADSIKELGIIQPITVRLLEDGNYQLITGERRFRASKKIGLKKIPAYIRRADDVNMLEMALIENVQREDLDSIEEAIGYQRLIEECKLTQETLSERVGKKRSTISNYLRLLKLPAEIQLGIRERKISMGHAKTLVTLEDPASQLNVYYKIIKSELSVRKAEDYVRGMQQTATKPDAGLVEKDQQYKDLQVHLAKQFGANVDFRRSNKGDGKIVISFKSDEDLERIIAILDKLNA